MPCFFNIDVTFCSKLAFMNLFVEIQKSTYNGKRWNLAQSCRLGKGMKDANMQKKGRLAIQRTVTCTGRAVGEKTG